MDHVCDVIAISTIRCTEFVMNNCSLNVSCDLHVYRVELVATLIDMASKCRQTSLVKRLIVIAGFSSIFLVGFVLYRNPPQSQDVIRIVAPVALPLYKRYRESDQPQTPIERNEQQIRRHGDGRPTSSASHNLPSLSADYTSSHQLAVQGDSNEELINVSQSYIKDSPVSTPVPMPSVSRKLRMISSPSVVSEVQRSESAGGQAPRSSENNRIPSTNDNDRPAQGDMSVPQPPAFAPAASSDKGAPLTAVDSQTQVAQPGRQQTPYIPHRCPPGFDKITDPEYDNWFVKDVVQRSPASSHSASSAFSDEILILTPVSNSAKHLQRYFENICSLVYPHRLISIVLGEDSSKDKTVETAQQMVDQLGTYFKRVEFVQLPPAVNSLSGQERRHEQSWQFIRRRHIATVRNRLLMHALGSVGPRVRWVLWVDSDIRHIPRDLVRHLVAANQSVVVPNCLWRQDNGQTATYDRNTWQETDLSRAELRVMPPDALMLEGYRPTKRRYLNDVKTDGDIVTVDGVGGCILLVDADLHRSGLVFPPFVFDHHIETEGFAKSVARFGARMYGLPSVNVIHW